MNLKKMIFVNTIITFLLAFLTHFLYTWLPNNIIAIFFPVNESIWEHMKMLYTTILIYGILEYFIMKKFDIEYNNLWITTVIKSITSIPIYLILFLPIYYNIGENMFIAITTMLISIFIVNIIGYKLLQIDEIKYQIPISIGLIIIVYIIMGILTFKTPRYEIFFDTKEEKYGINDYLIKE